MYTSPFSTSFPHPHLHRQHPQNPKLTTQQVQQGYFDILFPTDFPVIEDIYRAITGKLTRVMSHEDFLGRWAYVEDTQTRSGENPMLSWYRNASVMVSI